MLQSGFSFSAYFLKLYSIKLRDGQGVANYKRCARQQSCYNWRY